MIGEFSVIQNGVVVKRFPNTITTNGRKMLIEYIGKLRDGWGDEMVFGVGTTSSTTADEFAQLEVFRAPAYVSKVNTSTGEITLKASIPVEAQFRFTELGLGPSPKFIDPAEVFSEKLASFTSDEGWTYTDASTTKFVSKDDTTAHAGGTFGGYVKDESEALAVRYDTATLERNLDLSGYPQSSKILIGLSPEVSMTTSYGIVLSFTVAGNSGKAFSYTFPAGTVDTYNILSIPLSSFTAIGGATTSDWGNIGGVSIAAGTLSYTSFDTMRIERRDNTNLSEMLFSRATTSITTKWAGVPLDIEYKVNLGIS